MPGNICCPRDKNPFQLPSEYRYMKVLGEGTFGKVVKCWRKDKKDVVAVKIPKPIYDGRQEVSVMKMFMGLNLDRRNIVKFIDSFDMNSRQALVFEILDISIEDYILKNCCAPLLLTDIRSIIQDVAIALDALKGVGVIHTDIKLNNIMLVDHRKRPLRAKLIDFGLVIQKSEAKQGMILQTVVFRSPEIILGLPFSEAIDMWSVGGVMAAMILGFVLFPVKSEYEALQLIVKLLGQLADHLLEHGRKTAMFFNRTETNSWRLKTPQEYWVKPSPQQCRTAKFDSLDNLKTMRLERKNKAEAVEREQCVELLKAMFTLDGTDRITPGEVLAHPFITKNYPSSHLPRHVNKTSSNAALALPATTSAQPDHRSPSPMDLPTGAIMVRPAAAEDTLQRDEQETAVSLQMHVNKTSRNAALASVCEDSEPPASASAQPDHRSPSPMDLPTGAIMVRPAAAEDTLQLDEQETAVSFQAESLFEIIQSDTASGTSEDSSAFEDTRTKKKKKKKKNWIARTICACRTCVDKDEEGDK